MSKFTWRGWRWKLALFCKGFIEAYTNANPYSIHKEWQWRIGYWLGQEDKP